MFLSKPTRQVKNPYKGLSPIREQWRKYKQNLQKKGGDQLIEFDEFLKFVSQPCFYCGNEGTFKSKNNTSTKSNGVDRVKNNLGYFASNIVPCCKVCNSAKKGLSLDEFVTYIRKVASSRFIRTFKVNRSPDMIPPKNQSTM